MSVLDPQLLDALLKHPSITQDQQVCCALLATSNAFRSEIAARCSRQLTVQVTAANRQKQKALQLASWLKQHSQLVRGLDLHLSDHGEYPEQVERAWSAALDAVSTALQDAANAGLVDLEQFTLRGVSAPFEILTALSSSSLTRLHVSILPTTQGAYWEAVLDEIAMLQQLQELDIRHSSPYIMPSCIKNYAPERTYKQIVGLQHLTKLQLGGSTLGQLQALPPNLQELEVTLIAAPYSGADKFVLELAAWMEKYASLLTRLDIIHDEPGDVLYCPQKVWGPVTTDRHQLVAALQHAVATTAGGQLQLQHLSTNFPLSGLVYEQLAACCQLVDLQCRLDVNRSKESESLSAICSMTSLHALTLLGTLGVDSLQILTNLTCLSTLSLTGCQGSLLQMLPTTLRDLEWYET